MIEWRWFMTGPLIYGEISKNGISVLMTVAYGRAPDLKKYGISVFNDGGIWARTWSHSKQDTGFLFYFLKFLLPEWLMRHTFFWEMLHNRKRKTRRMFPNYLNWDGKTWIFVNIGFYPFVESFYHFCWVFLPLLLSLLTNSWVF